VRDSRNQSPPRRLALSLAGPAAIYPDPDRRTLPLAELEQSGAGWLVSIKVPLEGV